MSAQMLEVSLLNIRSRDGAPSRKGCVFNGEMTNGSNKQQMSTPAPNEAFHWTLSFMCKKFRLKSGS